MPWFPVAPDEPAESEIPAFCALQHIYYNFLNSCLLWCKFDMTCFLLCETEQNIFSASVQPPACYQWLQYLKENVILCN